MSVFDSVKTEFQFSGILWDINEDPKDNYIEINSKEYFMGYIDPDFKGNKGGNSIIFALYDAQGYDEYQDDNMPISVLKISKKFNRLRSGKIEVPLQNKRFENEVVALFSCKDKNCRNIVDIETAGNILNKKDKNHYPFYIMEYANSDLKKYIETENIAISEKIKLCLRIAQGLKELDEMRYYHRDLKPDNIFIIDGDWKIGDLGLVVSRDLDSFDHNNEFIGPRGWISPEAMNKYLTKDKGFAHNYDCTIDHQSDIFQLGKVFWYIIQGNAPIGCVKTVDFYERNIEIYALIRTMLNHSKKKRYKRIDEVITILTRISKKQY